MKIFAILKIAGRALRRNKLRTFLTMLGIIIGVGAVIAMVGIGNGAKADIESRVASLGQNVIMVMSGSFTRGGVHSGWGSAGTLTVEDARAIRQEISGAALVCEEIRSAAQVAAGNQNWMTAIMGEADNYLDIRQWPLTEGAMFTEQDVRGANKVAVIGKTTSQQLFGEANPVGQIVRIKNVPFTIIGKLTPKGTSFMGSDQDDTLIIPYTSAMKRILGVTTLRGINVQAESGADLATIQKEMTELLHQRHHIQPGQEDDFMVRTQQEIADVFTGAQATLRWLLLGIACVSLLVGGIGIMNIMLVSVTERTREIGIRMAVGARSRDILMQFLIEAITLSLIGGTIGIAVGIGLTQLVAAKMHWPVMNSLLWTSVAFFTSALVGILFGFYPAYKASGLNPIDALRYE